jgi:hypothetical protein
MASSKIDAEKLMNELLPFAKQMLKENGEFYPYGGYMDKDGKITHVGAKIEGTDKPTSQPLIELLIQQFQEKARRKESSCFGIVFDVRIVPPGETDKCDSIQVCLDHVDGYSAEVFFPYQINGEGELIFKKTFAQRGMNKIFSHRN